MVGDGDLGRFVVVGVWVGVGIFQLVSKKTTYTQYIVVFWAFRFNPPPHIVLKIFFITTKNSYFSAYGKFRLF